MLGSRIFSYSSVDHNRPFDEREIKAATDECKRDKAAGPDGFTIGWLEVLTRIHGRPFLMVLIPLNPIFSSKWGWEIKLIFGKIGGLEKLRYHRFFLVYIEFLAILII